MVKTTGTDCSPKLGAREQQGPTPFVATNSRRCREALYLFAGQKRKATVGEKLKKLGWKVKEIDILQGDRSHDLTRASVANRLMKQLEDNKYQALIASPPCDTSSRARYANFNGPRPLRSKVHPRGFPWLKGEKKRKVQLANTLMDLTWKAMIIQAKNVPGIVLAEFPEDLGKVQDGPMQGQSPSSLWQDAKFEEFMQLPGTSTMGLHQSDFGAPYLKPTRITMKGAPSKAKRVYPGLPMFSADNDYLGPIPKVSARELGLTTLARQANEAEFRTTGTAAWPPELAEWAADSIHESALQAENSRLEKGRIVGNAAGVLDDKKEEEEKKEAQFSSILKRIGAEYPVTIHPSDYWIGGKGEPRKTFAPGRTYAFHDGAGLTSPGRWDKEKRNYPMGKAWDQLREALLKTLMEARDEKGKELGATGINRIILQLACTPKTEVFRGEWLEKGREVIKKWLKSRCGDYDDKLEGAAEGQPFHLYTIHLLLREMRDADYMIFREMMEGVTAGILEPLPRTPAIYEEQTTWRLDANFLGSATKEAENYKSFAGFEDTIEEQFKAEQELGWMQETTVDQLKQEYGENFAISPLAVAEERKLDGTMKLRVLHDGTHKTHVNNRIRCRDKLRSPGVREKHALLRINREKKNIAISILADFSNAHRSIKIKRAEWGMMACMIRKGKPWINKVGTFGIASAAYWWSRLAGGLLRMVHGVLGPSFPLEALLFADDLDMEAECERERVAIVLAVFLLLCVGAPLKNSKFRGGFQVQWIGLYFDNRGYSLGVSPLRADWLANWLGEKLKLGIVEVREFLGGLGRLNFAASALYYEKPWLGPMYSWASAIQRADKDVVKIPWGIRLFMSWIQRRLSSGENMMAAPEWPKDIGDAFRSDAKAEDGRAFVGGWEVRGNTDTKKARWYYMELTAEEAPWVFSKARDPGRVIAALELLGTLLCIVLFDLKAEVNAKANCTVTGATDNQGNSFATAKGMSTKFPLAPILIEMNEQLRVRKLDLRLNWTRRDTNVEADAITNQDFRAFDEKLRIDCSYAKVQWLVLEEVLQASKEIYDCVSCEKEKKSREQDADTPRQQKRPRKTHARMKATMPW